MGETVDAVDPAFNLIEDENFVRIDFHFCEDRAHAFCGVAHDLLYAFHALDGFFDTHANAFFHLNRCCPQVWDVDGNGRYVEGGEFLLIGEVGACGTTEEQQGHQEVCGYGIMSEPAYGSMHKP